jgi:YVTN family beta-propeller protein
MDPAKRTVIATIPVGAAPFAIAAGSDSVWVANSVDATVSRIDPTTERVVATIPVGSGKLSAIAVGERGIWVASDDAVRMIDPATNKVAATVRLGGIYALVASGGSIWGTEGLGTKIHEIDEATATIRTSLALDTNSWGITAFEGSIWVVQPAAAGVAWAERAPGTITRLVP